MSPHFPPFSPRTFVFCFPSFALGADFFLLTLIFYLAVAIRALQLLVVSPKGIQSCSRGLVLGHLAEKKLIPRIREHMERWHHVVLGGFH